MTVPVGTTLEEAEKILHRHRIEKLLVVDDHYDLKGLITVKDIQKKLKYPNAAKDSQGRLRVAAAIGATGDFLERAQELVRKKVDVIAMDSAHGHSQRVMEAVKTLKASIPEVEVVAGNVASFEGARDLIGAGRGRRQGGHRTGLDLHNTRGQRRRRAADHSHCRMRQSASRHRRSAHRRWRRQIFGRRHQSHRRGRRFGDDRQPARRH